MPLTDAQVLNCCGYMKLWSSQIENQYPLILDNTKSTADRNTARQNAKTAFMNMVKMINTVIAANGWTNPGTTFTNQELTNMGLI